ncbi:uncharacterized protein LOC129589516 [Paramacrobiotus metropolitanus]|uniref:uncharacterized protein LOC129589516 n=1 Tax=Paramacrobiotus metropolitanus TaxID=2943436 RepID=UPI0024459882|nr:uncharacterized protein LOC129589516 [Paramacrobiotus metropolitanus]
MEWLLVPLLYTLIILRPALSYPFGAGPSACKTLVPGHGKEPQPADTLPFLIEPDGDSFVLNRILKVRIRTAHGKYKNRKISGFFVQARAPDGSEAVGKWQVEAGTAAAEGSKVAIKTQNCFHEADSVTHADSKPKSADLILHFLPTGNMPDQIQFMGTIARDYGTYWTNVRSAIVSRRFVPEAEAPPPPPPVPVTTHAPKRIQHITHTILHHVTTPLVHHAHKVSHHPRRTTPHRTTTTSTTAVPVTTADIVQLELDKYMEEKKYIEEKERNALMEKAAAKHQDNEENVQNDGSNPDSQAAKVRNGSKTKAATDGNAAASLSVSRHFLIHLFLLQCVIFVTLRIATRRS